MMDVDDFVSCIDEDDMDNPDLSVFDITGVYHCEGCAELCREDGILDLDLIVDCMKDREVIAYGWQPGMADYIVIDIAQENEDDDDALCYSE